MEEIASILDQFIKVQQISKQTVEEILNISLRPQSNINPYWNFYEGICPDGPFAHVQYREPGDGATRQSQGVILTLRADLQVTEPDVRSWYGQGTIAQIIPDAQSEGLVDYKYEIDGQELFLAYSGQTYRLSTVTFWR
jgi:hypothetical protein